MFSQTDSRPAAAIAKCRNRLVAALPADEYQELRPLLRTVSFVRGRFLYKRGDRVRDVYFPGGGACSLLTDLDGQMAEIAAIGHEGVIGASVFFGEDIATSAVVVSVGGGDGYAMDVRLFKKFMAQRGGFHNLVVRYSQAVIGQATQLSVCNTRHSADARACRWLLTTRNRVGKDEFALSRELFARVLGAPSETLAQTVAALTHAGAIEYRRGKMRISNSDILQRHGCECYDIISTMVDRLMPELFTLRDLEASHGASHTEQHRYGL